MCADRSVRLVFPKICVSNMCCADRSCPQDLCSMCHRFLTKCFRLCFWRSGWRICPAYFPKDLCVQCVLTDLSSLCPPKICVSNGGISPGQSWQQDCKHPPHLHCCNLALSQERLQPTRRFLTANWHFKWGLEIWCKAKTWKFQDENYIDKH